MRHHFILIVMLIGVAGLASAGEPRFAVGDWLLVRSRLAECVSWENRIVDAYQVTGYGSAPILGLGEFRVLGLTTTEIQDAISRAYLAAAGKNPPSLSVERVALESGTDEFALDAVLSFRAMIREECPSDPPQSGPRDLPTPEQLLRVRALAWDSRGDAGL
jgi:hypothetical protein